MTLRARRPAYGAGFAALGLMLAFAAPLAADVPRAASTSEAGLDREDLVSAGRVRLRVRTDPSELGDIVVGQQTRLLVEILTDTWFSHAPRYPELTIPGAITLLPEQMGTNFTEEIDGITFSGQRRSYVVFPQRVGSLDIPPLEIRLGVSKDGKPGAPFTLSTRPIRLDVASRPGVDESEGVVTTPRLSVEDEWDRSFDDLSAGDALERTIHIEGDEVLGMLLPDLAFEAPVGIAVYADAPRIVDRANRGRYRGQRTQTITYVLTERGTFEIPSIAIRWWNPEDEELRTETLASQSLNVKAAGLGISNSSSLSESIGDLRSRVAKAGAAVLQLILRHWLGIAVIGLIAFGLIRLTRAYGSRARETFDLALKQRRNSEALTFRALDRCLRVGDAQQIVAAYWHWRERIDASVLPSPRAHPESQDLARFPHWRTFQALRYSGPQAEPATFSRPDLRREIREMRSAYFAQTSARGRNHSRTNSSFRTRISPRLNPGP